MNPSHPPLLLDYHQLARTHTAIMQGLQPIKIEVEVDANRGTPGLIIIGLPTQAVEESKERITSALHNCGIRLKSRRTIVNLAPADIRKTSSNFELAIAVGLLKMSGEINLNTDDSIFFGELSLDGQLKPIRGALPLVLAARDMGFSQVFLPAANTPEIDIITDISIHPLHHLQEYLQYCQNHQPLPTLQPQPFTPTQPTFPVNFADIYGQTQAKRVLEIAAAGGHNLLLTGPPGAGKSMLAQALMSILPPLTEPEAIEVTNIYSICGLTTQGLITARPFRSPHHTTSQAGLLGGGAHVRPGEISLAHRGVLFLDEFPEFQRDSLEALRQPLEQRTISLSRANGSVTYPASFALVAAANPCPCGYYGSLTRDCDCTPNARHNYHKRLSGPILDRIDMQLRVPEVDFTHTTLKPKVVETSASIQARVIVARQRQAQRLLPFQVTTNAETTSQIVRATSHITPDAKKLLRAAARRLGLSARGYFRIIKVSQTIADLSGETIIQTTHLAEALQYRQETRSVKSNQL